MNNTDIASQLIKENGELKAENAELKERCEDLSIQLIELQAYCRELEDKVETQRRSLEMFDK